VPAASAAWPGAEPEGISRWPFLLFIIVVIALGIIGAVVKGLLYLLIIGVVVLLADFSFSAPPARTRTPPGQVRQ
jgi:hypothetical protein